MFIVEQQSRAPDAAQRDVMRCRAGAHASASARLPGSRLCAATPARCSASGTRAETMSSPHTPSLRGAPATKQSSLPPSRDSGLLPPSPRFWREQVAALAMTMWRQFRASLPPSCPGRCAARSDALQSRGPCFSECAAPWVPALRSNACALQRVRDTSGDDVVTSHALRGALATKKSRLPPSRDSGLLPPSPRLRRTSRCAPLPSPFSTNEACNKPVIQRN